MTLFTALYCGKKQVVEKRRRRRPNGSGTVIKLENGKYKAVKTVGYYHEDGILHRRTVTKTFPTAKEAQSALPELGKDIHEFIRTDFAVKKLHEYYLATHLYDSSSQSNKDKMTYAWNRCIHLQARLITSITVDDIQSIIDNNKLTFYPAKDVRTLFSHIYRQAIRRDVNVPNKSVYVEFPQLKAAEKTAFTNHEIALLWADYADENFFAGYILLMIYTGMRFGELSSIRKNNVHLEEQYLIGGIKSEAGRNRKIPIADKLLPITKSLYRAGTRKLLEMNEDNFYKRYYETLERLGIRRLSPHTCRHTFFTRMTAAGVQPGIITEAGGHTDFKTTQSYIYLSVSELISAVNKI